LIVSQSKDGEMIRYVLEGLGYRAIQGSSSRRGSTAYREMVQQLKRGGNLGITPDGPRGPARRVQAGAPRLAVELGANLYPTAISARKFWLLPSWDRFLFPKPFTEVVILWGEPIRANPEGGPEEVARLTKVIKTTLDRLTDEVDREAGHPPLPREKKGKAGPNRGAPAEPGPG
ncbi:MAG: lysophospholipid acyltransferase family protein, partial [Planctomycetota bacterium]